MIIPMNLGSNSYNVIVERNALQKANEYLNLNFKLEGLIRLNDFEEFIQQDCSQIVFHQSHAGAEDGHEHTEVQEQRCTRK